MELRLECTVMYRAQSNEQENPLFIVSTVAVIQLSSVDTHEPSPPS